MSSYLGIDTSNYTTSMAVFSDKDKSISIKKLLKVKEGKIGLRQSDAVFLHIKQIPELIEEIFSNLNEKPLAIGASSVPRSTPGSYMPCFEVGKTIAKTLSYSLNVPLYNFSHQCGHIVSALYSSNRLDLLDSEFIAFHVSGGTTEAVFVKPSKENIIECEIIGGTLDLNAGQVIDRVGSMLGLSFPAGPQLEKLALECDESFKVRPSIKGSNCCLSGLENKCRDLFLKTKDKNNVALYCITYLLETIDLLCNNLILKYGDIPIVFAGGVMSNIILKNKLQKKYNSFFADPIFSSDNAMGTAILASLKAGLK